tara:strand:- start:249 stop:677 length:429 start_codon:yes stop_codon:yes gene_type:complete
MQKILNVRISLLVLGLMTTLLGLGNLVGAEDWAKDQWIGAQGRELDIATSIELAWGAKIVTVGLMILILSFILSGAARARFGVIAIVLFVAGEIFTVSSLSAKGYGEGASIPVLFIIVPLLITLWALVSCAKGWNEKTSETT